MGYTHYWELKAELNEEVVNQLNEHLEQYFGIIREEYDCERNALISKNAIMFNGVGEEGHETFLVTSKGSAFCKTARKPYDLPVCEALLILKGYYKDKFIIDSDGFSVSQEAYKQNRIDENWNEALENVKKLGYEFELVKETSISGGRKYYQILIDSK